PIRGQYCLIKPIIPVPDKFKRKEGEVMANSSIEQVNKLLNDEYIETYIELFKLLKNTILRFGVCIPDKCNPVDVENAINKCMHCLCHQMPVLIRNLSSACSQNRSQRQSWTSLFEGY